MSKRKSVLKTTPAQGNAEKGQVRPPFQRILYVLLACFFVFIAWYFLDKLIFRPNYQVEWGVSFSPKISKELGVDPRENLTALLDDMQIKHFRLMSYWEDLEAKKGDYNFSSLDWQVNEVAKRGGTVSLAIGLRQPRWPECHAPDWIYENNNPDASPRASWQDDLLAYIKKVVVRYEHNPTVESWQLENEYANAWGLCAKFGKSLERLQAEFDAVKAISKKPVIMNLSDEFGVPLRGPTADEYGFSIYGRVYMNALGTYIDYPNAAWYQNLRGALLETARHRGYFIHELQMEPWGPNATNQLTDEEQDISMSSNQIAYNFNYGRRLGATKIDLWGSEWWFWRLKQGDASVWNQVKTEIYRAK